MRKLRFVPTLTLAALAACATPAPLRIVDTACTSFRSISFAQPPKRPDGVRETSDPTNSFDSDETVREVEGHNARYDALCPSQPLR